MASDDTALNDLVRDVGLEWPAGLAGWEERLREVLEPELYAQYMEARMGFGTGPDGPAWFDFVGKHHALALLLQEGRLGYHKAALPAVAEAVAAGPHGSIADLGCGCGLGTLYLARRFPGSRVVGVERSPGLAGLAAALKGRAGVANAEFVCGDYTGAGVLAGRFDVAVTMLAMPAFLLPYLPSERPESYRRGEALRAAAADPLRPHRQVRRCLDAARLLLAPGGRAVTNERGGDASRVLLFACLANEARLGLRGARALSWESPIEARPGRHLAPLAVFEALPATAPFDEDAALGLFLPPPGSLPAPSGLGPGRVAAVSGPLAAQAFQDLGLAGPPPVARAAGHDGRRAHLHLGTSGGIAYAYTCDTHDGRELKLAAAGTAGQLFHAATEPLLQAANARQLASLDPPPERFPALLRSLAGG
jgi:SAM-dependent methyltransferase